MICTCLSIYSTIIVFENSCALHLEERQNSIKWIENEEIQIFREYLQIPTVQPNADYRKMFSIISNLICTTKRFIYRVSCRISQETSGQFGSTRLRILPSR